MSLTPFHGPPAQAPVVPGFAARMLIGSGAHGEVWLAREQISGDEVALKIGARAVPPDGDPIVREAELLSRFDHPHLVRLRRVVALPGGGSALVLDLAGGGSLAALVAARGRLQPGEVVTMLVPLAEVLHEVHGKGVTHGDVAPGNVLFAADGRPLLGDLGVASVLGARAGRLWSTPGFADPAMAEAGDRRAADVWSLAAVAWFALTGRPPDLTGAPGSHGDVPAGPLPVLLAECLATVPDERPGLPEIAARAWDAVPAVPVQLHGGPSGAPLPSVLGAEPGQAPLMPVTRRSAAAAAASAAESAPGRGRGGTAGARVITPARLGRRHVIAAASGCLVTAVAAAVSFGIAAAPGSTPTASGVRDGARPETGQKAATTVVARVADGAGEDTDALIASGLQQIADARALAFQQVSESPLKAADEPGSAAARMDGALIAQLRRSGLRLDGIRYAMSGVRRVTTVSSDRIEVLATVATSAHRQVSTRDGRIRLVPATPPEQVRLTLVRTGTPAAGGTGAIGGTGAAGSTGGSGGWLVRSVEPVP